MTPELARQWATYNAWMNEQIFGACETISDEKRKADLGAFFKSIHATLVHILVSDKLRMHQFDPTNMFWPGADKTDDFEDWAALWAERRRCDAEITRWAHTLTPDMLARPVQTGCWVDERQHVYPLGLLLMHSCNHGAHHRGQVTTLMWQLGVDFGITGFAWQPDLLTTSLA